MPFWPPRGAGLELEAAVQPGQQGARTQQPGPRCSELEREWQAVEPGTDRGHVLGVLGGQLEIGACHPRVLDEESDRAFLLLVWRQRSGQRQLAQWILVLSEHAQR